MDRPSYIKAYLKDYRSRHKCVNVAVPIADYKKLEKAAKREGMTPARLLLTIGLRDLDKTVYVPAEIKQELSRLTLLIRNIANNINQIAHHTNTVRQAADARTVFAELAKLERAIGAYCLGRLSRRHDHQVNEP